MVKFFNHYHPDHAVGFGHPYSDGRPISWHYTLGYRGYDLEVAREVSFGRSAFILGILNCRSLATARFAQQV